MRTVLFVVATLLSLASTAWAESGPRWESRQFTWFYNPAGAPGHLNQQDVVNELNRAFGKWAASCGVVIQYGGITSASTENSKDGASTVGWRKFSYMSETAVRYGNRGISEMDMMLAGETIRTLRELSGVASARSGTCHRYSGPQLGCRRGDVKQHKFFESPGCAERQRPVHLPKQISLNTCQGVRFRTPFLQ